MISEEKKIAITAGILSVVFLSVGVAIGAFGSEFCKILNYIDKIPNDQFIAGLCLFLALVALVSLMVKGFIKALEEDLFDNKKNGFMEESGEIKNKV